MFKLCVLLAATVPISALPVGAIELKGTYFSFRTGGDAGAVVDRYEARQSNGKVTFYRNGAVGQKTPVQIWDDHAGEVYDISGNTLTGAVTATVQDNGDIVWSHGYTSRPDADVTLSGTYYSFKTGGDSSAVVDRFEARQPGGTVTFYRNGQAGESYGVSGYTLTGAVTAAVQDNGDIIWSHGYTSRKAMNNGDLVWGPTA